VTHRIPILSVVALTKRFGSRVALDGVSFPVHQGDFLSIVGESGSGKSTLLRCLALLEIPDLGEVRVRGNPAHALRGEQLLHFRRQVQIVMQDAAMSMNPSWDALRIVGEPLAILRRELTSSQREHIAAGCLHQVGLGPAFFHRHPLELSGGQRQRLQIARALTLAPELLLLDEPFAGLDAPVQADLLALLQQLRRSRGLTCILVTHDLELAWGASTAVALLQRGHLLQYLPVQGNGDVSGLRLKAAAYADLASLVRDLAQNAKNRPQTISTMEGDTP
jgi:ABC-type dipeptide/oligopeptide/nickel transport system ATPase subunit